MVEPYPFWLVATVFSFAFQLTGFCIAYPLRTEKFFDTFGATNFLTIAIVGWCLSDDTSDPRRAATTLLFCASRLWLLIFLGIRAHDRGDARFEDVKGNCGAFLGFWIGQAVWVCVVSLPIIAINSAPSVPFGDVGFVFVAMFALSLMMQAHSDIVKYLWVQKGRPGHFCRSGCWNFSRHPNYAGELGMAVALVGLTLPILINPGGPDGLAIASVLSPIFTFMILMFASGMPLAEGEALRRYYEKAGQRYADYRAQTPILLPCPVAGYEQVPMFVKQLFCCEWSMYELPESDGAQWKGSVSNGGYQSMDSPDQSAVV